MNPTPPLAEILDLELLDDPALATDTGPPNADHDDLRLITIAAAAERLELSRSKLYELIADGEVPTVRIGRARRIALADLRAFVARHRAA